MPRVRPDTDAVLLGALRAGVPNGVTVVRLRPDDFLAHLPMVSARTITADATDMVRFVSYAEVDVQSWASTPDAASNLDDACLAALIAAQGRVFAGGYITRIVTQSLGTEVRDPDQPGRLYRWQAGYRLTIRPA